eukprot:4080773-Pleurochrysis_carterae.AAC.2
MRNTPMRTSYLCCEGKQHLLNGSVTESDPLGQALRGFRMYYGHGFEGISFYITCHQTSWSIAKFQHGLTLLEMTC